MKNQRGWGVTLAVLGLAIGLLLSGCGGDDGGGGNSGNNGGGGGYEPPKEGLVTFTNVPTGYVVNHLEVGSIPVVSWTQQYGGNVEKPVDDVWKPIVIGYGNKKDFNTASIQSNSYKNENGVWVNQSSQTGFNFTGVGCVYAYFTTAQGVSPNTFGINNVQFTEGNATIDFAPLVTPSISNEIDEVLAGTSWKDNLPGTPGTTLTISFTTDGITWGGTAGNQLNTVTSAYQGTGYTFVWIAKDGNISYKYSYNGNTQTVPVYTYTLSGDKSTLELKVSGYTFATMIPAS